MNQPVYIQTHRLESYHLVLLQITIRQFLYYVFEIVNTKNTLLNSDVCISYCTRLIVFRREHSRFDYNVGKFLNYLSASKVCSEFETVDFNMVLDLCENSSVY